MLNFLYCWLYCFIVFWGLLLNRLFVYGFSLSESNSLLSAKCPFYPMLTCISSCTLSSSCWGISNDNSSYIYCSWNAPNGLQQAASIHYENNNCSIPVICSKKKKCYSYIYYNDSSCSFMANARSVIFSVSYLNNGRLGNFFQKFNPCYTIKMDPPQINSITKVDDYMEIIVAKPNCVKDSWTSLGYQLTYSVYNRLFANISLVTKTLSSIPFYIPFHEACQYNFSLTVASDDIPSSLQVWSEPFKESYLTAPVTAVDNNYINFQCSFDNTCFSLTVTWKKSGIIKFFHCELMDNNSNETNRLIIDGSRSKNENVFQAYFDGVCFNEHALLMKITAENDKGLSNATSSFVHCNVKDKIPCDCQIASRTSSLIQIKWTQPKLHYILDGYQVILSSTKGTFLSKILLPSATQYQFQDLQECVFYKIDVVSFFGNIKAGSCTLQSYTVETEPLQAPNFKIQEDFETYFLIFINHLPDNKACGEIITNIITVKNESGFFQFTGLNGTNITGLLPFSNYNVSVSAVNSAGHGPFSLPVSGYTQEAAPSNPPTVELRKTANLYLILWNDPLQQNGILAKYLMIINHSFPSWSNSPYPNECSFFNNITKCVFGAENQSVLLPLMEGDAIMMCACTDKGKKCSSYSSPIYVQSFPDYSFNITYILIVIALLIFASGLFLLTYILRSSRFHMEGPLIHPSVIPELGQQQISENVFSEDFSENEVYESIRDWRKTMRKDDIFSFQEKDLITFDNKCSDHENNSF